MKTKFLSTALLAFSLALGGVSAPAMAQESTTPIPEATATPESISAEAHIENDEHSHEENELGPGHVVPGPNTPLIQSPDGSLNPPEIEGHDHGETATVPTDTSGMMTAAASAGLQNRQGDIKVTLVTARLADKTSSQTRALNMAAMEKSVSDTSAYWKSMSNNRLSMTIANKRIDIPTAAKSTWNYPDIMAQVRKELNWQNSPYTALVVFIPTADLKYGAYGGYLGAGWSYSGVGGTILMPQPSSFTSPVVAHEFGHTLGILHANSLQCTNGRSDVAFNSSTGRWSDSACTSREYGDTVDLMGTSQYVMPTINSLFWDVGGFGRGDEIRNVGTAAGSKTYNLTAWSGTAANRAVKFTDPVSKEDYYLELRLPVGYDGSTAYNGNRGVKIVKRDKASGAWLYSLAITPNTRPFAGYYNTNHAWQAGQTFTTHAGTRVKINSISSTSASVTVTAASIGKPSIATGADIVAADSSGALWNYGQITGAPRKKIGSGWQAMESIHVTDWNADKVQDLVAKAKDGKLYYYKGKPTGGFTKYQIGNSWQNYEISVGKWKNGDRFPAIIAKNTSNGGLFYYENSSGHGLTPQVKIGSGWQNIDVNLIDFDKDGNTDVVARMADDRTLVLYRSNGNGRFVAESRKQVGHGWQVMDAITPIHNFRTNGAAGFIAKHEDGRLLSYATGANRFSGTTVIGNGWQSYNLAKHQVF